MTTLPFVVLTNEMIEEAVRLVPGSRVRRTVASGIDTLTGHLGEFAFADYFFGDWRKHRVGKNKGEVDFPDIEIKASAYPFRDDLYLPVREDYAKKRKPPFYALVIVDVDSRRANSVKPGTRAYICGYASANEVDASPLKDLGSKRGGPGGYLCHCIEIRDLHPPEGLAEAHRKHRESQSGA